MRELGFNVSFRAPATENVVIVVHIGESFTAKELIADEIFDGSIGYFVDAIASAKGMNSQFKMAPVGQNELHISAPRVVLDQHWHIGAILNLLDGATFLGQEDDEPFIERVEVLEPLTLEAIYDSLKSYMDNCRAAIDEWMPEDTEVLDGSGINRWPTPASDYIFDLVLSLSAPLPADAQAQLTEFLERMDGVLAESAFEAGTDPGEWFDEGIVPYPVEFEVNSTEITYGIEMPPSDIAPILLFLTAIMQQRFNVRVTALSANIREGW